MLLEVALIDVQEDGAVLLLLDGRKLQVRPSNIIISCQWSAPVLLEIVEDATRPQFPLSARNTVTDTRVQAMWK